VTFDEYLKRWIEDRKRRGKATVNKHEQRLTDYVLPVLVR
jgi:hypothetical protein